MMTNIEKYMNSFVGIFGVGLEKVEQLEYQSIDEWDSIGHMMLIAKLEEEFDFMMDTDDIIDFSSFKKGKEVLNKYGVEL